MKGSFTLPGEAGQEALTLRLAEQWGADVIRDSDGTQLSDELLGAGYGIYSTLCLIRSLNDFALQHPRMLQQNLLMSMPVLAGAGALRINLLAGYSRDQFRVADEDGLEFWQVFDRTAGQELPRGDWRYEDGFVTVLSPIPWHRYTVNFFAYRLWEAISMYNHITNHWGDRERLMPVEPRHPAVQAALLNWLDGWCKAHPHTDVVRFTSLFYNFAWIWSDDPAARDLFSDWGSYDFSVNPVALRAFRAETGIDMTSEDFLQGGLRSPAHNAPTEKMRRWMAFTHAFVADFGRQCVEVVHRHGKQAYLFYDDSWVGAEPYGAHFAEMGFDGIIKCVFNAFEARLCADVPGVNTHEIRLHPYLFPTGLTGEPTFAPGGQPTPPLWQYWMQVRRGLLRRPVDRIGLGGYLHLVEPFPDFCEAVASIADDFRALKALHAKNAPQVLPGQVLVLTEWGNLRPWTTSGHLHEHPEVDLLNALEAMAGMPLDIIFRNFEDLRREGVPEGVRVILNAGWGGSAWSGGESWRDPAVVALLTAWVHQGGALVGIREPSAPAAGETLALSHLFGVSVDSGARKCQRKYRARLPIPHWVTADGAPGLVPLEGAYLDAPDVAVLAADGNVPLLTAREVGAGRAVYLSGYRFSFESVRFLLRALCYAARLENLLPDFVPDNVLTECALFDECAVVINHTDIVQCTTVPGWAEPVALPPMGQKILPRE
jgi:beta-D-galactosyl-(1->4)-L-rhamnose phosphorylase